MSELKEKVKKAIEEAQNTEFNSKKGLLLSFNLEQDKLIDVFLSVIGTCAECEIGTKTGIRGDKEVFCDRENWFKEETDFCSKFRRRK